MYSSVVLAHGLFQCAIYNDLAELRLKWREMQNEDEFIVVGGLYVRTRM